MVSRENRCRKRTFRVHGPGWISACIGLLLLVSSDFRCLAEEPVSHRPLQVQEGRIVDDQQIPVTLRGCNLGNWLVLELWMLDQGDQVFGDQFELETLLRRRFGEPERARLMDLYREHWLTDADFARIRSFGMNLVRLPFEYGLLEDEARPFELKPDAWRWLDRAVELAERHGIYVILDLHGAPGRQSAMDHTGRRDLNRLWSSEQDQARTVWLWKKIAEHYRDRPAVMAYDLLNEPWGGTHDQLGSMVDRLYHAVREVDEDTTVVLPGYTDGIGMYGDPRDRGWTNYIFTMHWYPGFFGWGRPTPHVHKDFLEGGILEWGKRMQALQVPLLVGEFNVVLKAAGGGEMMRRYFDAYGSLGWPATLWSYKALTRSGGIGAGVWGMVTNADPLPALDLEQASLETIEDAFRAYSSMAILADEDLRHWLTTEDTPSSLEDLPPLPPPLRVAPAHDALPAPWQAADIGNARPGGQSVTSPNELVVYGGGDDIWQQADQFRFTWQVVTGDVTVTTQIVDFEDTHPFAKAGVMIRGSLEPGAVHALLNVFPSGGLEFSRRAATAGTMQADPAGTAHFPDVHLKLVREGDRITAFTASEPDDWRARGTVELPGLGDRAWVGLVALSHDNRQLTRITFRRPWVSTTQSTPECLRTSREYLPSIPRRSEFYSDSEKM